MPILLFIGAAIGALAVFYGLSVYNAATTVMQQIVGALSAGFGGLAAVVGVGLAGVILAIEAADARQVAAIDTMRHALTPPPPPRSAAPPASGIATLAGQLPIRSDSESGPVPRDEGRASGQCPGCGRFNGAGAEVCSRCKRSLRAG